ncbi:MAG TPA: hypothetical protein VJJ52_04045 [Candidatus Nanoarchaeia archaeon]|nr:hypothetical protein [Candidatus Nanoarchaeia archaeon]
MGIHDVAVRLGLSYTNNKEAEWKLAKFIEIKLINSAKIFEENIEIVPHTKTFIACIGEVWQEKGRQNKFFVEDSFLKRYFPDLCGQDKPIRFYDDIRGTDSCAECHHVNGKYKGIAIWVGLLEKCNNVSELSKYLQVIIANVYHECSHAYMESNNKEIEDIETQILYFTDEAEIRAISNALAVVYSKAFPHKSFNFKLLKLFISENYDANIPIYSHFRMIDLFRDPKNFRSDKNQELNQYISDRILPGGHRITVAMLRVAFVKYMNYMSYFVDYLNKNSR